MLRLLSKWTQTMKRFIAVAGIAIAVISPANLKAAEPNAMQGQRAYGACAACHSLEANRNMTGPSLSGLWNRKAGSLDSFARYSTALKSSEITWNDKTLDAWIENPQHVVPGNTMTFAGIKDPKQRTDLLAFLKQATQPGKAPSTVGQQGGGMMGMMGGAGQVPHLKNLGPEDRVKAITYCKDTYKVTMADGKTRDFWERNLRLKTDSSEDGPDKGAPALVDAGMMGDRADVIFADPEEIAPLISHQC
jgi:cytochrome c